ncbi:hypothetical protein ACOSQ3_031839 [Xanthoceras sorbifolium]
MVDCFNDDGIPGQNGEKSTRGVFTEVKIKEKVETSGSLGEENSGLVKGCKGLVKEVGSLDSKSDRMVLGSLDCNIPGEPVSVSLGMDRLVYENDGSLLVGKGFNGDLFVKGLRSDVSDEVVIADGSAEDLFWVASSSGGKQKRWKRLAREKHIVMYDVLVSLGKREFQLDVLASDERKKGSFRNPFLYGGKVLWLGDSWARASDYLHSVADSSVRDEPERVKAAADGHERDRDLHLVFWFPKPLPTMRNRRRINFAVRSKVSLGSKRQFEFAWKTQSEFGSLCRTRSWQAQNNVALGHGSASPQDKNLKTYVSRKKKGAVLWKLIRKLIFIFI